MNSNLGECVQEKPVVTLVVDPGRYKFTDFVKVGVPLLLLTYVVTLLVAPLVFPFHAF